MSGITAKYKTIKTFINISPGYRAVTISLKHAKICKECYVNKRNIFQSKFNGRIYFNIIYKLQASAHEAGDRTRTPLHTPETSETC